MRAPLTIFMFGYWGWGNATRRLVEAADAVEKSRGFRPPYFVDIRIHRNVRAVGFHGDAFERTVGKARHRWMPELGNRSMLPRHRSNRIRIDHPEAAEQLLDLALNRAKRQQRVIYFCSCEFPDGCHRGTVGDLLLEAARKKRIALQIVEWPGGEPTALKLKVPDTKVPRDKTSRLYLPKNSDLATHAGLALGSLAEVTGESRSRKVTVAPAMYARKGWYLPVLQDGRGRVIAGTHRAASDWRKWGGYLPRATGTRART